METINLTDLYENYFGYTPGQKVTIDGTDSKLVTTSEGRRYEAGNKWYRAADLYGRPIFMPVTVGELFLPYCWLTISGGKNIKETLFTERRGSVKEIITEKDLRIDIEGFVMNADGTFPEDRVIELRDLWARQEALEIDCPLTDLFLLVGDTGGQDKVVIFDWELLPNQGVEHVKGFRMSLVSDAEIELEIE